MTNVKDTLKYTKNLKVLYVEDNEDVRITTHELLSDIFSSVDSAEDGQIGLDKYIKNNKEEDTKYDLVVSDINMPNMNGIEMIKEIKKLQPHQDIVVISAHNESDYLLQLINLGISSFVLKPLNLQQFMQTIYTISQKIYEHQFTLNYYNNIETLNHQLEVKNSALNDSLRLSNTLVSKELLQKAKMSQNSDTNQTIINKHKEELIEFTRIELKTFQLLRVELNNNSKMILENLFNNSLKRDDFELLQHSIENYIKRMSSFSVFDIFCKNFRALETLLSDIRLISHKEVTNIFLLIESFIHMSNKYIDSIPTYNIENLLIIESNLNDDIQNIISLFEGRYSKENLSFFDLINS